MTTLFINKIIGSILQLILFSAIPFIWWLCTARKKESFFKWIGLKKADEGHFKKALPQTACIICLFIALGALILYMIKGTETATSDFTGMGAAAIPAILVYAIFNTSLPEEIVFRGFLLKRIQNKFGFKVANFVQAFLFGLLHGVMFFTVLDPVRTLFIILFTGVIAAFMGYINEKKCDGSLIPGWMIHASSNIFSGLAAAFLLF